MSDLFSRALSSARGAGKLPVVVDIKPVSPRDGNLVGARDAGELARSLEEAGACALSVVTEPEHFGGSLELLRQVVSAVSIPVLRKDFLKDPEDVDASLDAGASAVLLTLSTVPELEAPGLYRRIGALGMEPLVEVHNLGELHFALGLDPPPSLVGINNRDITALERDNGDVRVTEALAPEVPEGVVVLSESAILTPEDVRRALKAGAHAVLVGTAVLQAPDPAACVRWLAEDLD